MSRTSSADRWRDKAGEALADEVFARLMTGRSLSDLGLGEVDGRVDLRSIPVPTPRRLERFETLGWFVERLGDAIAFKGVRLEGLDFSSAQLRSLRFHGAQVANCRFDRAACQDWRLWGSEVTDCTFVKSSLRDAAVGTWREGRRNSWRRVDFTEADFRVGVSWEAVYEHCDFTGAKLTKTRFEQCTLIGCRFAGDLHQVVFDGRDVTGRPAPPPMADVDFSDAVFSQVEFLGCDLDGAVLPKDPDVRLVRRSRCVARRGVELLEDDDSREARMLKAILQNRLRGPGTESEARVFNRRDYLDFGGPALLALAEKVFTRAEADCLG